MSANSYLKDWEPYSAISKFQGDILADMQKLLDSENCLSPLPNPQPGETKIPVISNAIQDQVISKLEERELELENLCSSISTAKTHIESLKKFHDDLMGKTNDFQAKCGTILREQKTLLDISDELTKSLDFYKEVDNIARTVFKKSAGNLLAELGFPKIITMLEDAEAFFIKNVDYLDSKEYLIKISSIKRHLCELFISYIQQSASDQYIQNLPSEGVSQETITQYKTILYAQIPAFDLIKPAFMFFQELASKKSIPEFLETVDSIAATLFTIRKGLVTEICDFYIRDALKSSKLSEITQKLFQIQCQIENDEIQFFKQYFSNLSKVSRDIFTHFETLMYNYLRPLIIKENNVTELSSAILFTKKAFFDPKGTLAQQDENLNKKFLAKVFYL